VIFWAFLVGLGFTAGSAIMKWVAAICATFFQRLSAG
jgi:hypothetical protein